MLMSWFAFARPK